VGVGGTAGSGGFVWPEDAGQNIPGNGVWTFNQGNVSHNNHDDGLFVWQNTDTLHDVSNFVSYHNGSYGIEHGAYVNSYRYANAALFGNGKAGLNTKAKPKPMRPLSFENLVVDGGGVSPSGLVSFDHVAEDVRLPTLFFCTVLKGQTGAAVALSTGSEHRAPEIMDFVESQLSGTQFSMKNLLSGTRIRVQSGGSAFQLDASGNKSTISPFVTVKGGCQPGPTSPPGLPGAPSAPPGPLPPTPGPTTTVPSVTTTTEPPPAPPPGALPRITAPASGSTVNGVVLVTVSAEGLSGIRRIDLYVDGAREQADYRAPFLFAWPSFALPAGSHTLRAVLVRTDGTSVRSSPTTVETTGH
jgi:hypothetical protein